MLAERQAHYRPKAVCWSAAAVAKSMRLRARRMLYAAELIGRGQLELARPFAVSARLE